MYSTNIALNDVAESELVNGQLHGQKLFVHCASIYHTQTTPEATAPCKCLQLGEKHSVVFIIVHVCTTC